MNIIPLFIRRRIAHRPNLVKIADNIGWLFLDKVFRLGVGLIVGAWLARYLGPEQFGMINFAAAFVGMFGVLAVLGLQNIVVRDLVIKPANAGETMGSAAVLQLLGGGLAFGAAVLVIFILRPNDALMRWMVVILAAAMIFRVTAFANYWFEAQVQSKYTVWVTNGVFLVIVGIKILLILNSAPVMAFVWTMFAEAALGSAAIFFIFIHRGPGLANIKLSTSKAKSLLCDSWPLILSGIAVAVYMKIDQVMLGQMLDDEAVGIYSAAVRLSEVWYFIPISIVASVFPAILVAKKESEEKYYLRLQQLYDLMVGLALIVAIPMTFISDWIIVLLFGVAYQQAGTVLAIHIWAAVFVFLGVASGKWFLAENRQILSLQRTALGAVLNIVMNVILIPRFGVIGAAWATVVSYSVAAFFADAMQKETRNMFRMKAKSLNPLRLLSIHGNKKLIY